MRKATLTTLLAIVSTGAAAEWTVAGRDTAYTVYVDRASIRKTGSMVKMWDLFDFKTSQVSIAGEPYMSMKGQIEYDCKEEQSRGVYGLLYTENMGSGKVVSTDQSLGDWAPIAPESAGEALWKIACGKL